VTNLRPKDANFNLPHLHLAPPLGMTRLFCKDLHPQKTRVPELSCGVVCVILRLAVSVEHRLVSDGRTQTQLRHRASMASCGTKCHRALLVTKTGRL